MLWSVAEINADLGDVETAAAQFEESLTLFIEFGDRWFCGIVLESAAFLAAGAATPSERSASSARPTLSGRRSRFRCRLVSRHVTTRVLAEVRSRLGEGRFEAAWDEGSMLPLSATVDLVQPAHSSAGVDVPEGLTTREIEVLALVAEGLTDAEVAERLVVSIRTVHAHLRSIYRKLDVRTRSAATRYALEHDLAL